MDNKIVKRRGRPAKAQNVTYVPSIIDFSKVTKLSNLGVNAEMLKQMKSGLILDELFSYEKGVPKATNIMVGGEAGVGKTTILLDLISAIKIKNPSAKILFISAEMGRKQMYKYTQRFPQFGNIDTLFTMDYLKYNTKDIIEQILDKGYDVVLTDSIAEVIEGVRDDNNWDRKNTESWFVDVCVKNNSGENKEGKYTTFINIQQLTKSGEFAGSNRLKHLMDATAKLKRDKNQVTYITFEKNRNGMVGQRLDYTLTNNKIIYGTIAVDNNEDDE